MPWLAPVLESRPDRVRAHRRFHPHRPRRLRRPLPKRRSLRQQSPRPSRSRRRRRRRLPRRTTTPTRTCIRLFSGRDHSPEETREAITLTVANNDKSMVPLLIEMLRFFGDWDLVIETNTALSVITGREFGDVSGAWNEWMEWLGKNADEYRPPDGYVRWKSELMSLIDPRFGEFLAPAEQGSRINVCLDCVGRRPAGRDPGPSERPEPSGGRAGLPTAERPGLRRVHQRRAQGVPTSHRERPRDGQRRVGGRTHRPCLLNALRHRNRVFRQDHRRANHLRHVGDAVPQQQGHVRPADQLALEPSHGRACDRAVMGLGDTSSTSSLSSSRRGKSGWSFIPTRLSWTSRRACTPPNSTRLRRTRRRYTTPTSTRLRRCSRSLTGTTGLKQRMSCWGSS